MIIMNHVQIKTTFFDNNIFDDCLEKSQYCGKTWKQNKEILLSTFYLVLLIKQDVW